jgi:Zn-dependent protease
MTLSFRLGRIPVRVQPWFFVLAGFLGMNDYKMLPVWIAVVFVAVLIHELGHALTGMSFGLEPRVELHGMGGTTTWAQAKPLSTVKRVAISLAGPFAGFALGGAVVAADRAGVLPQNDAMDSTVGALKFVTFGWGAFNLLPMLPLDGGHVMADVLKAWMRATGEKAAYVVSMIVAALLGVFAVTSHWGMWGAYLVVMFLATNWRGLQAARAREADEPLRATLEKAHQALEARDPERLIALARPVALGAQAPQVKAEALQLLAYGFLLEGRLADADAAIAAMPQGYVPHPSLVAMRDQAARA